MKKLHLKKIEQATPTEEVKSSKKHQSRNVAKACMHMIFGGALAAIFIAGPIGPSDLINKHPGTEPTPAPYVDEIQDNDPVEVEPLDTENPVETKPVESDPIEAEPVEPEMVSKPEQPIQPEVNKPVNNKPATPKPVPESHQNTDPDEPYISPDQWVPGPEDMIPPPPQEVKPDPEPIPEPIPEPTPEIDPPVALTPGSVLYQNDVWTIYVPGAGNSLIAVSADRNLRIVDGSLVEEFDGLMIPVSGTYAMYDSQANNTTTVSFNGSVIEVKTPNGTFTF